MANFPTTFSYLDELTNSENIFLVGLLTDFPTEAEDEVNYAGLSQPTDPAYATLDIALDDFGTSNNTTFLRGDNCVFGEDFSSVEVIVGQFLAIEYDDVTSVIAIKKFDNPVPIGVGLDNLLVTTEVSIAEAWDEANDNLG